MGIMWDMMAKVIHSKHIIDTPTILGALWGGPYKRVGGKIFENQKDE